MFPGRSGRTTPRCSILNFCGVKYARLSGFKISIGCPLSGFLGARGKDDRKSGPSLSVAGDTALLQVTCNSASKASLFATSFGTLVTLTQPPWGGGLTNSTL